MGYCASGSGSITFTEELPKDTITAIEKYCDPDFDIDTYTNNNKTIMDITAYGKYHAEDIDEILKRITRTEKIASGEIEFTGEDDAHWRFIWDGNEWFEQDGRIVYDDPCAFGHVIWNRADIEAYIDEDDKFPADADFVDEVLTRCQNNHHFTDGMIEAGWQSIANTCFEVLESRNKGE